MPSSQPSAKSPDASLDIKSILLLDDDVDLADTLKALLETRNFVVTTVGNGVEGLREIMAFDFDVIMCDLMMPKMPGDMFYTAVQRAKPQLCERFIFITGHGDKPSVGEFLKKTNALILAKPVNTEELIRAISFVLNRARRPAAD